METLKLFDCSGWQDCGLIFFLFISTYINACVENNHLKILLVSFKKIYPSLYLRNIFALSAPTGKKALPCVRGRKGGPGAPTVQRQVGERHLPGILSAPGNLAPTPHARGARVSVHTEITASELFFRISPKNS